MKTKLFTLLFAVAASVGTMFAWDYEHIQIGDLYYNLDATNQTAVVISSSDKYSGDIVIPSSVTYNSVSYSVTSIGYGAFDACTGLTSVTIPNSVTSIGNYAFRACRGLTSVTIPNSVTSIGNQAFEYCTGLTSVTIPNSVTSIGGRAFQNCSGLTSVTIGNGVSSIGESAFFYCIRLTSLTIGKSVTSIGYQAFYGCTGLKSVTIPNSVTSIGHEAFHGCYGLTSVTIPNSVTSIGNSAFYFCYGLTSVTIGNSVSSIGDGAFYGCSGLTSVTIPNSVTSIGEGAFEGVPNIVYSGSATGSPWGARSVNGYVEGYLVYSDATKTNLLACSTAAKGDVEIPNSVTSIGEYAFGGCTGLTSITCEAITPPTLGSGVFYNFNKSTCVLYVPAGSVSAYKSADQWKDFLDILPISAQKTETTSVQAEPTDNSVSVSWPQVSGAASYELVIKDKDGNVVCTLIFNAQGQLTSIAFNAPSRDGAPQQTQTAGFLFTITGLEAGTDYNLTITAKNSNDQVVDKREVSFHTNWPSAIENLQVEGDQPVKVYHEGQIYILRGEKIYNVHGAIVK